MQYAQPTYSLKEETPMGCRAVLVYALIPPTHIRKWACHHASLHLTGLQLSLSPLVLCLHPSWPFFLLQNRFASQSNGQTHPAATCMCYCLVLVASCGTSYAVVHSVFQGHRFSARAMVCCPPLKPGICTSQHLLLCSSSFSP